MNLVSVDAKERSKGLVFARIMVDYVMKYMNKRLTASMKKKASLRVRNP